MTLLYLFLGHLRVGLLGFGGGPSMLPLMQAECVNAGWVTDEQFLEGLAIGNALPGPITTKMAVYVGYQEAGIPGAVSAVFGITTPSALLMLMLGALLVKHRDNAYVAAALRAVKPAVVGMLFYVAWDLGPSGVKGFSTALVAGIAFLALVMRVHPAFVMLAAVGVGLAFFRT